MWELLLRKYKCISHLASNRRWAKWTDAQVLLVALWNVAGNIIPLLFHIIHYKIKLIGIYFQLLLLLHSARDAY